MKSYPHQIEIFEWFKECLNPALKNKILRFIINAMCGVGKTHIAQLIIYYFLVQGKRVLFLTYTRNELREQTYKRCMEDGIIPKEYIGIFKTDKKEIEKFLIITIPQTIRNFLFPYKFDLIIIDEAHEYLETKDKKSAQTLKKIIALNSHKNTVIIGLTGTAFEIMLEGKFFDIKNDQVAYKIYDSLMALEDGIISNININAIYVNFELKNEAYKKDGELSSIGQEVLKDKLINALKANKLIPTLSGKTLMICAKISDAESLSAYINSTFGNGKTISLCKTSNQDDLFGIDLEFKNHPGIQFLIVVGMCGVGWDFPGLMNVVDLTFTINPKLIIQRFSRAVRKCEGKEPNYYYVADERKTPLMVRNLLFHALYLTTKKGIETYIKNNGNISAPVFGVNMNKMINLSSMENFYNELEKENKKRDILELGDFKSYAFLMNVDAKSKMIFQMSLKQLKCHYKEQKKFFEKMLSVYPDQTIKIINQHISQKRNNPNTFKLHMVFRDCKNISSEIWDMFFKGFEPENMLL
jgi:superfamily II DNA or RNA helicase